MLSALAFLGALLLGASALPQGPAPEPVPLPHFPDPLHAFVWRNWQLVPAERMARVVGATPRQILDLGHAMGLSGPPRITTDQQQRSAITVIRRNWHLLPYDQLLTLLGWTEERLAYTLREDDFLYTKLGSLKPRCAPLRYAPPDEAARRRERAIAGTLKRYFPDGVGVPEEPLFSFVSRLSRRPASAGSPVAPAEQGRPPLRFCYSYFALYGDPLLPGTADPYPEGYLQRLRACGVNGVWLQAVLYKLAPFPWDASQSERYEERLRGLRSLVDRARRHGMRVFLYLNEPRAMPLSFYAARPELKGVVEGDYAALCTSAPEVQRYISDSVERICREVPDLGGFFTITASENLTNCWSHGNGAGCPRCSKRTAGEVIAEVNSLIAQGIRRAGTPARLVAWDWGWPDAEVETILRALPKEVSFMSVSEWSLPIRRGGVETSVGEYSLSSIGPGPRATRHWKLARNQGLKTLAKVQAANTWELSAVPYIPALENTARHAAHLRAAGVEEVMLGWTLGGYPSPNLEIVAEVLGRGPAGGSPTTVTPDQALERVARRRFGQAAAPAVVRAWQRFSAAFSEFPFHGGLVYTAPMQMGPANLLWARPTGYQATMVGFPYDDLNTWRAVYPAEVFVRQFERVAEGFDAGLDDLRKALREASARYRPALQEELRVAEAAALHFRSTANQARFVQARDALAAHPDGPAAVQGREELRRLLRQELDLAVRLHALQSHDSRLGFEASNQYYYVPVDLAEKVLDCAYLLDHWVPQEDTPRPQPPGDAP